jgi:signal transduction histidine kinase/CheY-like chemotaxis protein
MIPPSAGGNGLRRSLTSLVAVFLIWITAGVRGQVVDPSSPTTGVLTNIAEIWGVPRAQANKEYRIKTEAVIYFTDPEWGNASGECLGTPIWLPIFDSPIPLKAGERVAIDGVIVPSRERFVWNKTRIEVLEERVPLKAEPVSDLGRNPQTLSGRLVSVEGLVDSELDEATHCTINFLSGNIAAKVYVVKGADHSPVQFKPGDFIRIKCVYSAQFDRDGKLDELSLWVGTPANIEVIGTLATDKHFDAPVLFSKDILTDVSPDNLVRVEGVVHKYEPGQWVTIWDATGQIMIQSQQTQPLRFGDRVEVIGYPYTVGVQQCLRNGLYRLAAPTNRTVASLTTGTNSLPLRLAEQVRGLSLEEASQHLPVNLRGVVTWAHFGTPFAYVQDGSGGIQVVNPKWDDTGSMKSGTIVLLDGMTDGGGFVPVVTNAVLRRAGWWNLEGPRPVTLEQMLSGLEEGNWVEMRGFVRNVNQIHGLAHFVLSTSSGEFQAWTPAVQSFDAYKGAIVHLQGVCCVLANSRHQLMGIQIMVPDQKYIQIEEPAPYDLFTAPLRPLANLRRFNVESALNQRIRTSGTVVLYVRGHYVYVQDGADSVFALSQQTNVLQPGDQVEVVGFPGTEGKKFVLREAVYRRVSSGTEPSALPLSDTNFADANLDGLLVRAEGILLNKVEKNGETDLLVQTAGLTFEAALASAVMQGESGLQTMKLGSRLALTGVYEVQNDEHGQPRSFLLHLRSANDVQLRQQPPWWTLARLLAALVGTLLVFLIALVWGVLITRKNALLHQAQADLQAANNRLETRVAGRTAELETANAQLKEEIAKQLKLEAQLRHSQKMEAVGQLAAGVAHDFNNILTVIQGNAAMLRDQPGQDPSCIEPLNDISVAAERAARLVRQLLAFSRKQVLKSEKLDLGQVVNNLRDMLQQLVKDRITLEVNIASGLPPIQADLGMMEQVVMNLSINARDAMPDGGTLSVGINAVAFNNDDAQKNSEVRPGQYVCLSVSDTGCGIAPELLPRIFDPFFTTKEIGKGTGLGLATVYGVVKQHNGWVDVQSAINQGTIFRIFLPVCRDNSQLGKPAPLQRNPAEKGSECILVVEDEDHLRALTAAILRKSGYRVLEAASGRDALGVFQDHSSEINLLFTDIMMPGNLLGDELAVRLRASRPSLPVLFTSGYTPEITKTDLRGSGNFLSKPFTPAQMLSTVRSCLDQATVENGNT